MSIRVCILLLLLTLFLIFPFGVFACEPQPDHWFYEVYNIGSMLLPENVTIELSPRDSAQGYLTITNNSDLPLHILPQDARGKIMVTPDAAAAITEDGLAEENTLEEILLVEKVPELASFIVTQEASLQLDIENLPGLVPYIEVRNISDYLRPSLIYLPITQRGEFHLVYNEQIFTVQFTISYALNEDFSPEVCGNKVEMIHQQEIELSNERNSFITDTIALLAISIIDIITN